MSRYRIDHRHLFLFGFLFYLVTPLWVGMTDVFQELPGVALFRELFRKIPDTQLRIYLIVTACWLPCFFIGHYACSFLVPVKHEKRAELFPATATTYGVTYLAFVFMIVMLLFIYLSRASLFGGYGSYDVGVRGKMSTLLVVLNFFLLYQWVSRQSVSTILIASVVVTALLLLSMGGRMYVFQTLVVVLIYKTSFSAKRWTVRQLVIFGFVGFLLAVIFGLMRMGVSLDAEKAAYSIFAEPAFTWFSTTSYLASNEVPLFNFPSNYLTSFLNLVPNTFISLKPYIVSTASMVENYQNPLGADSIWSTLVINFGSAGSCLFIFMTGFICHLFRDLSLKSRFGAVFYIMICSILPFQFFRDGFYILHKQIFFNFLLLPAALITMLNLFLYVVRCQAAMQPGSGREIH